MTKKKVHPLEEDLDVVVANLIRGMRSGADVQSTFTLLADMLRDNVLPASGRDYVAELLDKIAKGKKLGLPWRQAKSPKSSNIKIWAAYERMTGSNEVRWKELAKEFKNKRVTTLKKDVSHGRKQLKALIASLGGDKGAIEIVAEKYRLPVLVITEAIKRKTKT